MKKASKKISSPFPLLLIVVGLGIFFLIKSNQNYSQKLASTPDPISSEALENTRQYSELESYVSKSNCEVVTKNWNSADISDVLTLKIPSYIRQFKEFGGQSFEINHPSLGRLLITTSLAGGFKIDEADSFNESLEWLIGSRGSHLNNASFYLDGNLHYVIGDYHFLVANDEEQAQWWMFSVIEQDRTETGTEETEFTKTDDFKCLVRSVIFD